MVNLLPQAVSPETSSSLSTEERVRLQTLERIVEKNLDGLLAAGKALAEIRSSRLYRQHFATFEQYVRERWALSRSRADELCRSNATAELLLSNGLELPGNISESALRPVSALPSPELQVAGWKLIQAASPAGVTQPISSKICRVIKNAISSPSDKTGRKPRHREHPTREQSFISPVRRLSAYQGFDANLVTSHVEKFSSALSAFTACRIMADRCLSCCDILSKRFPELTDA
jgi:hypothetical protein